MGSVVHWVLGLLLGVATPLQQQSIRELMSSWSVGFGSKGKGMRNMDCMLCGLGGIVMLGAVHLYDGDNTHLHANVAHLCKPNRGLNCLLAHLFQVQLATRCRTAGCVSGCAFDHRAIE